MCYSRYRLFWDDPPCPVAEFMDQHSSEVLPSVVAPANGAVRVWRPSVSSGMRTVEEVIRELAQNDVPVMVVGERGSGKAAAAARIHALSRRTAEPFEVQQGADITAASLAACADRGGSIYVQGVCELTSEAQVALVRLIVRGVEQRNVPRFLCGTSVEL